MALVLLDIDKITAIANATRTKTGTQNQLTIKQIKKLLRNTEMEYVNKIYSTNNLTIDELVSMFPYLSNIPGYIVMNDNSTPRAITIPNNVYCMQRAFYNCKGISSVVLQDGTSSVGAYAFEKCTNLASVTFSADMNSVTSHLFAGCTSLATVVLPNNIIDIGTAAFINSGLMNITMPSVTSIQKEAFAYTPMTSIPTIPSAITSLPRGLFSHCNGLTSVTIPSHITTLGGSVFLSCANLKTIIIPDSVTSVSSNYDDFYNCSLEIVRVGNGLTIVSNGLVNSASLKKITLGSSVASYPTFTNCSLLEEIIISQDNATFRSANNCVIRKSDGMLLNGCKTSIIPNDGSVTSIANSAFCGHSGLNEIDIPDSVTSIGNSSFRGTNLTKIFIPSTCTPVATTSANGPFIETLNTMDIYTDALSKPSNWSDYWDSKNALEKHTVHYGVSRAEYEQL